MPVMHGCIQLDKGRTFFFMWYIPQLLLQICDIFWCKKVKKMQILTKCRRTYIVDHHAYHICSVGERYGDLGAQRRVATVRRLSGKMRVMWYLILDCWQMPYDNVAQRVTQMVIRCQQHSVDLKLYTRWLREDLLS